MSASKRTINTAVATVAAITLVAAGSAGTWLFMRSSTRASAGASATPASPPPSPPSAPGGDGRPSDLSVMLSEESIKRAGIVVAKVSTGISGAELRLPGVVEPNAYRQVEVTPLAAGRVTSVGVTLGQSVRRGQTLAQIYSPELAEAQTAYVAAAALLDARDRELQRTEKLVSIGAASRQELERIRAEQAAQSAAVQSARARLDLLGVSGASLDGPSAQLSATVNVPAPISGVITERLANPGLNVDTSTRLFTVIDLSSVWVVAEVFEKDFSRVRVGSEATITSSAYPQMALHGRVSYIDPHVNVDTRTARARVEVANPRTELRLGMYADVVITSAAASAVPVVPRSAVQNVGDRTVVYLADSEKPGTFIEREVRLGRASGDAVSVESGLKPGDTVVTEGSFFVRAERDRLGIRRSSRAGDGSSAPQEATIVMTATRFEPSSATVHAGQVAQIVFPSLHLRRPLPLNLPRITWPID